MSLKPGWLTAGCRSCVNLVIGVLLTATEICALLLQNMSESKRSLLVTII